jgi:hypothetical protein
MHNTDDRPAILWRLRARQTTAHCVLQPLPVGALLTLRQDDDIVLQEIFPDTHLAERRAVALRSRLEAKGWRIVLVEGADRRRRRA